MTTPQNNTLSELTKWILLAAGLALLAITTLTAPWLEVCRLQSDHNLMLAQTTRLTKKTDAHYRFAQALQDRDPTLLQRLAFEQMRTTPQYAQIDAQIIDINDPADNASRWAVDQWLDLPPITPPKNLADSYIEQSLMVRLTQGPPRLALTALALLCIAAALFPSNTQQHG